MIIQDCRTASGHWRKTAQVSGVQMRTKACTVWRDIAKRCQTGGGMQKKFPSYVGCSMSANFQDFQFFANWYTCQIGYGIATYQIDKDILIEGNKEYHEDKCVLVPYALNSFLCAADAIRGKYPQGVSLHRVDKFSAHITVDNKAINLGVFSSVSEAQKVYQTAKEQEARRWYTRLLSGEFIVDPRVTERMRTWTLPKETL